MAKKVSFPNIQAEQSLKQLAGQQLRDTLGYELLRTSCSYGGASIQRLIDGKGNDAKDGCTLLVKKKMAYRPIESGDLTEALHALTTLMPFQNIIKSIRSYYPVSDESINQLVSHFTPHDFPAKHLIIRSGIIDKNVYFIENGLIRSYCLVDGNEHTTWFSKEGDITFGLLCLYHNKPGFEFVETVEPTLAYSIPINILNKLYETNIEIANWGRVIHQECLLTLQCVRIDNLTMTAKERYNVLLKRFPDICQRVNLGYIASFLGVSISTLSRIRAEK